MHTRREPTPRCYIRRCQTRYSEPSLYLYEHTGKVREREKAERRRRGREENGGPYMYPPMYARGHICTYTCHPLRRLRVHMYRRRVCRAAAWLATHTEIRGHKCRWDLLMQLGKLSFSIQRVMHEITIRTLFEMNFIRATRSRDDARVNTRKKGAF